MIKWFLRLFTRRDTIVDYHRIEEIPYTDSNEMRNEMKKNQGRFL